jgi:uncharacterized protein
VDNGRARLTSIAVLLLAACSSSASTRPLDSSGSGAGSAPANAVRIPVTIDAEGGTLSIQAEIADTPSTRQKGLMFRTSMAEGEGMIFLFPTEEHLAFWMHNTLIPLDMIFIRSDHTILGVVENATPETDTPRQVPGASQFVLEMNGGVAQKHGVRAGQHASFYAPLPSS